MKNEAILEMIRDEPCFIPSKKTYSDNPEAHYCDYHEARCHATENCWHLIKPTGETEQRGEMELPPPPPRPMRTINMIFPAIRNGTRRDRRGEIAQINMIQRTSDFVEEAQLAPPRPAPNDRSAIWFSFNDLRGVANPHLDALVISINIANHNFRRSLVDGGSTSELMLLDGFLALGFRVTDLEPPRFELFAFNDTITKALGDINLTVVVGPVKKQMKFVVAQYNSSYNVILGRGWIHEMMAVPSTLHQVIRFPTEEGLYEIRGNQAASLRCMELATKTVFNIHQKPISASTHLIWLFFQREVN